MKAVILAGGLGTRISRGDRAPAEADGRDRRPADPLAHHEDLRRARLQRLRRLPRLQGLHDQGVLRQLLRCTRRTVTIDLANGHGRGAYGHAAEPWRVTLVDTGEETHDRRPAEAGRAAISADEPFCSPTATAWPTSTSRALVAFHRAHGKLATVTAVQPPGRFGALALRRRRGDALQREAAGRRRLDQRRLLRAVARGAGPASRATRRPGRREPLRAPGRATASWWPIDHDGFWQPMDTLREKDLLERLWASRRGALEAVVNPPRGFWRGTPGARHRPYRLQGRAGWRCWLHRLGAEVTGFALPPDRAERCSTWRGSAALLRPPTAPTCATPAPCARRSAARDPRSCSTWRRSRWCGASYRRAGRDLRDQRRWARSTCSRRCAAWPASQAVVVVTTDKVYEQRERRPRLPRGRRAGRPRSLQRIKARGRAGRVGMPGALLRRRTLPPSPPRAPAMSSAAATGRATG